MEYVYEMSALRIYSKVARKNYSEMAEAVGISPATMTRYISGERLPDIDTLVRICNMLRISVGHFIHHPNIELSTFDLFLEEEWKVIKFQPKYMEIARAEKNIDKKTLINEVRKATGVKTALATYNRIINGENSGCEFVVAFLNTFKVTLDSFFKDNQLEQTKNQKSEDEVVVSRRTLIDLRSRIKQLEEDNLRLYTENKRFQHREKARLYTQGEPQDKANKRMLKFINKLEQELAALKNYLPNDCTTNFKEINQYNIEEPTLHNVAEDTHSKYGEEQE